MASNSGPQTTGPVQPVKLSLPLKFQQEIFQEVRAEDELVIMARGLGLLRLVANLLHSYDAAGNNLILLMGADEREAAWLGRSLIEHKVASGATKARGLTCVDSKETPKTRQEMYARGGLFSVTARILIGDMLSGVVQAENVTGIVVLHAQKFTATSNEAFILRVWRGKNRSGFLKAFSDKPEAFIRGFSQLTKMLGSLFLRKVSLWPRYHVTVASSLEGKRRAEVIELEVPMTGAMLDIQNAIKECVEQCVQEIRKTNTGLDLEEWDARTVMLQNFDVMIRRQLEPNWHRISNKTRRIVGDLTVLRALLQYVLEYDAVAFLEHLDYIHATYAPDPGSLRNTESPWLFLDAAQTIFESAQKRVYAAERHSARHEDDIDALRPVLEELPKWAILAEVLDEIDRDIQTSGPSRDDSSGCILIMCQSSATCRQLRDYLQTMHLRPQGTEPSLKGADSAPAVDQEEYTSASYLMRRKLRTYLRRKREFSMRKALLYTDTQRSLNKAIDLTTGQSRGARGVARGGSAASKRRRVRGGGTVGSNPSRTENGAVAPFTETPAQVTGLMNTIGEAQAQNADVEQRVDLVQDEFDDMEQQYGLLSLQDLLVIHAYDGDGDDTMLEQVKPRYIVMYDVDAAFIRRIEVYRSSHNDRDVRSYFMYYADSVEEERYLSAVRREKDAFTQLIRERASMTLTLDVPKDSRASEEDRFLSRINTRIAGGGQLGPGASRKIPPRVIVDIREFRSSLPPLLHGHGMDVVPCQLTVGDYILSPRICVERKAISDLIQSLNSGRLWTQCEAMFRHYACPLLLIEFDHNKSFTLERFADMGHGNGSFGSSATVGSDLQGKIVALTLAFPRLRIIWSSSPYETAEIFQSLKSQEYEPDPRAAVEAGLTTGEKEAGDGHLEPTLQAMMAAVPGVTPANMAALTYKARNIKELANTKREDLVKIVGPENAGKIDYFFSRNLAH